MFNGTNITGITNLVYLCCCNHNNTTNITKMDAPTKNQILSLIIEAVVIRTNLRTDEADYRLRMYDGSFIRVPSTDAYKIMSSNVPESKDVDVNEDGTIVVEYRYNPLP